MKDYLALLDQAVAGLTEERPLDLGDCMCLIGHAFEAVVRDYEPGALSLLDEDPELAERFERSERRIDEIAAAQPKEREFREALKQLTGLIREMSARMRARAEARRDDSVANGHSRWADTSHIEGGRQ